MEKQQVTALLTIAIGLFAGVAAAMDWKWYMNHRKAQLFVKMFGYQGARVFYMILGLAMMILGALILSQ